MRDKAPLIPSQSGMDPEAELHRLGFRIRPAAFQDTWALWPEGTRTIFIVPSLPRRLRRAILFHELAHIRLGHSHCVCYDPRQARRNEREADQWAARKMISLDALAAATTWARNLAEVADELGVPEHWVMIRLFDTEGLLWRGTSRTGG